MSVVEQFEVISLMSYTDMYKNIHLYLGLFKTALLPKYFKE